MGAQVLGFHHQRVAAGDQDVGDLRVRLHIALELAGFLGGDLEIVIADELRPAETEGAVAVAHLALAGEKQHRLVVLVLNAVDLFAVHFRNVVFHLPGGVRVEGLADLGHGGIDLRLVAAAHGVGHLVEVFRCEHAFLRKGELVDRVVGHLVPVDQFLDHVFVDAERQHVGHHAHGETGVIVEALQLFYFVQLACGEHLEAARLLGGRLLMFTQRNNRIGF